MTKLIQLQNKNQNKEIYKTIQKFNQKENILQGIGKQLKIKCYKIRINLLQTKIVINKLMYCRILIISRMEEIFNTHMIFKNY